jgi:hypothetical protein
MDGRGVPDLMFQARFLPACYPTLPDLEVAKGVLKSLPGSACSLQPELFLCPLLAGHYLPVSTASYLLGLLWKPNLEGKEGGQRRGPVSTVANSVGLTVSR